jgi:hypothetical protein
LGNANQKMRPGGRRKLLIEREVNKMARKSQTSAFTTERTSSILVFKFSGFPIYFTRCPRFCIASTASLTQPTWNSIA